MHSKATTSLVGMTLVGMLLFPTSTNAVSAPAMPSTSTATDTLTSLSGCRGRR